ncbi:hypothetical protein [Micrococcus terreus]|nr:hypothetical protein [Micrococcus terreus]
MDILKMGGPEGTGMVPTVTIRRWSDLMPGQPQVDPRQAIDDGVLLATDRWVGDEWFGLRFVMLTPLLGGMSAAVVRWLLWPTAEPDGVDPDESVPVLDVVGTCSLRLYSSCRELMDMVVAGIPSDWGPATVAAAADDGFAQAVRAAQNAPRLRSEPGPWGYWPLTDVSSTTWSRLADMNADEWRSGPEDLRKDLLDLEFIDDTGELTTRGNIARHIRSREAMRTHLDVWTANRHARPLLIEHRGLCAVVRAAPAGPVDPGPRLNDSPRTSLGLMPAESVAEMICLGLRTSTRTMQVPASEPVHLETLVTHVLNGPGAEVEGTMLTSMRQASAAVPWTLWRLSQDAVRSTPHDTAGAPLSFTILDAGPAGVFRLFRPEEPTEQEDHVVLAPWPGSEVLASLLEFFGCPGPPAQRTAESNRMR